jgi:hypothetical protein
MLELNGDKLTTSHQKQQAYCGDRRCGCDIVVAARAVKRNQEAATHARRG